MKHGGLPYTLNKDPVEAKEYTMDVKDDIIRKDLPIIQSHEKETIEVPYPLLDLIALHKPGTLSERKLSNRSDIYKTVVKTC